MTIKPSSHAEMNEGQSAFERFREAVKTIIRVPKSVVTNDRKKAAAKRKRTARPR